MVIRKNDIKRVSRCIRKRNKKDILNSQESHENAKGWYESLRIDFKRLDDFYSKSNDENSRIKFADLCRICNPHFKTLETALNSKNYNKYIATSEIIIISGVLTNFRLTP